ncbi:hypothetical protein DXG03_006244 [Asterophora parasitica]|uniref:Ams2/SPT21 N-terminal domain-containing protein n=1 Tax=Asterophora parasitica TaxID=117018 RepID=A0A9P7KE13_9AGAR|nr:hypothetical protein DXG03_006244 [Asterophora parasitica]
MESRKLSLRILYTINSSPQYILARSSTAVPIVLVPSVAATGTSHYEKSTTQATKVEPRPEFATVSLKTCLDAICRSSPELLQDLSRDFSVYVLDPLESNSAPAPVNISSHASSSDASNHSTSSSGQSRGVAVGLGLMSWALLADEKESAVVTGTLINLPTGHKALEVIFALRETAAMQEASLPATLKSWGLPPEPSSKATRVHASKSHRESKHPLKPSTSAASACHSTTSSTSSIAQTEFQRSGYHSTYYAKPCSSEQTSSTSTPSPSYLGQHPTSDVTTLATIASIQMRTQHKRARSNKPKKPPRSGPTLNHENSEADRLLLTEDVYVGPVRKKGRPLSAVASGSRSQSNMPTTMRAVDGSQASPSTVVDSPNADRFILPPPSSQQPSVKKSLLQDSAPNPFISSPLIRSPRDPDPPSLLDILACLSASAPGNDPTVQSTALLAALSAIDSTSQSGGSPVTSDKPPNPTLVNALRDLLSAYSGPQSSVSNIQLQPSRCHPLDDEIVLLDKENVNPTAFRRRSERDSKLGDENSAQPPVNGSATQGRSLTTRSNVITHTTTISPAPANSSPPRRKRTLSETMDERENGKGKAREREWLERRDAHRHGRSSPKKDSTHRYYPRLSSDSAQPLKRGTNSYYRTGTEPWTSPPKPRGENSYPVSKRENSKERTTPIGDYLGAPKVSASSPVRSNSAHVQARRKYVVPAWARTETSTQPRLSQEAQRSLELAEERKKEKDAVKRRGSTRTEREKKTKRVARSASPPRREPQNSQQSNAAILKASQRPPPVTVANDYPVFAITSAIQDRVAAFSSPLASMDKRSPRSSTSGHDIPPCTPPRKRYSSLFSPGDDGSLFTPMPRTPMPRCRDSEGRRSESAPVYRSQRKGSAGSVKRRPKTPSPKVAKSLAEDGNEASAEESEEDLEDLLNRELDTAFHGLDAPSSSQQTASSDVDMDKEPSTMEERPPELGSSQANEDSDTDVEPPKKQHWVGLPPSSPLPPTSPLLMPQEDEADAMSDDMELPVATSDYPTDSEVASLATNDNDLNCTDEELAEYLSNNDFAPMFPPAGGVYGSDTGQSDVDVFQQFTHHNSQSDDVNASVNAEVDFNAFQNGLADFDFTEFWETFKPLLDQEGGGAVQPTNLDPEGGSEGFEMTTLDHVKLAEDVQALFSGCLM